MSKILSAAVIFAALAFRVTGHTSVESVEIGGQTYQGFYGANKDDALPKGSPAWKTDQGWGYQPVFGDMTNTPHIIAHFNATTSPNSADAPAGSPVTFHWHHVGACGEGEEGWDCSHHGWTSTWMARCKNDDGENICTEKLDKTTLEFFKIDEVALTSYPKGTRYAEGASPHEYTGKWGTDAIFYDNGNAHTVNIPSGIPSGQYVLRTEVASIHNNGAVSQRQFWPQAFNINVSGGDDGKSVPAGVKATEIYNSNDELLTWDLYWHDIDKIVPSAPGPKLASVALTAISKKTRRHAKDFSN